MVLFLTCPIGTFFSIILPSASIVLDREIDSWLREDVRSTRPAIYLCSVIYLPMGDKGTQVCSICH